MEQLAHQLIDFILKQPQFVGLVILGCCALIEYIFPPFPGDTVTLFGAVLVARYGWNMPGVFAAVLLGSLVGAMGTYYFGRLMGHRYAAGGLLRNPQARLSVDKVTAAFARHGEIYVALNRFLPAVRSVFFLAAGMVKLRPGRVAFWSLVSAAVWNALILAAGYALGANWQRLRSLAQAYSTAMWIILLVVAAIMIWRWRKT